MDSYDFVVVGGGSAGCVLAARLSEDAGTRVLLLEAGPAELPDAARVPQAWPSLLGTAACWGELTTVQAATGTATFLPRGRGLGGSSSINAMLHVRGHRSGYDVWEADGAKGWGYEDLLPYFKRTETTEGRDPRVRGVAGPLTVAPADPGHPVLAACLDAAVEVGHARATDISSGLEEGFGWADLTVVGGARQSAADAYLIPALDRPNLHVVTDALVHRVRIEDGVAAGVDYSTAGESVSVSCTREVVLTAGTIGSALVLLRSGVGPASQLREHGVPVVVDLPGVGENFHDHPIANVVYSAAREVPAGRHNHGEALGLMRSDPAQDAPDLQVIFVDGPGQIPSVRTPEQGYTIGVSLMRPHSRGSVRLSGPDPSAPPVLDPDYYGDERDMTTMLAGLRLIREIGAADALSEWRDREVGPGANVTGDEELRA